MPIGPNLLGRYRFLWPPLCDLVVRGLPCRERCLLRRSTTQFLQGTPKIQAVENVICPTRTNSHCRHRHCRSNLLLLVFLLYSRFSLQGKAQQIVLPAVLYRYVRLFWRNFFVPANPAFQWYNKTTTVILKHTLSLKVQTKDESGLNYVATWLSFRWYRGDIVESNEMIFLSNVYVFDFGDAREGLV